MSVIDSVKEDARNSFKPLETRENEDQTQWSEFSGLRRDIKTTANRERLAVVFFEGKGQIEGKGQRAKGKGKRCGSFSRAAQKANYNNFVPS